MTRLLAGIGLAGLLLVGSTGPARAQDVHIQLSWGVAGGRMHVASGWRMGAWNRGARVRARVETRHFTECVPDGPYLYCWDAPRRYVTRPVVYVYVTDRAAVARMGRGHGRNERWERAQRRAAERAWRRWADRRGYRYDRDHFAVDVAFAW
jgi:hypothetical protein